jgi:hypothetical protein
LSTHWNDPKQIVTGFRSTKCCAGHVADKRFARPKVRLGVPIDERLRGQMRDWVDALLFDTTRIRRRGHDRLQCNGERHYWVLMF